MRIRIRIGSKARSHLPVIPAVMYQSGPSVMMAPGGDIKATCVRYAHPSAAGPGAAPSANAKGSADAGPQIVGYVLPVTIASHAGPLASLSITNPSDRIIHLKADVKEWHQDAFD